MQAGEAVIRHGNERVLRARFNDARFFWEFDQRISLNDRVALLKDVTFQKDLGSYALKSERVTACAQALAGLVVAAHDATVDQEALTVAARLAKADLTTEMVKEFTELQGEIGGLYAKAQGIPGRAADAIYDHYRPVSMEDRIPRTVEGQILAIADKADTISGMFSLGMQPTGSKDPFALRRAANGIVKILAEGSLPLTLSDVANCSDLTGTHFLVERLEFYLREARGQAYDVVKAVLAAGSDGVRDVVARAEAVSAVRGTDDFAAVSAAFKRMKNILDQAAEKGFAVASPERVSFSELSEAEFWIQVQQAGRDFDQLCEAKNYVPALARLASLRASIDAYFLDTMVMADDSVVRANRLGMLRFLVATFSKLADFSEIVVNG